MCSQAEQPARVRTPERAVVDVVAAHGSTWIKVVARNPEALLTSSMGDGEYGRRTILDQVRDLVTCAACHPHLYRSPRVTVWTALPICEPLREIIEGVGAQVSIACSKDMSMVDRHSNCFIFGFCVFGIYLAASPEYKPLRLSVFFQNR